jgi:hypothetical protein
MYLGSSSGLSTKPFQASSCLRFSSSRKWSGTNFTQNYLLPSAVLFMCFTNSAFTFISTSNTLSVIRRSLENKFHTLSTTSELEVVFNRPLRKLSSWWSLLKPLKFCAQKTALSPKLFVILCAFRCGVIPQFYLEFDVDTIFHFDIDTIFHFDVDTIFHFDIDTIFHFDLDTIFHFDVFDSSVRRGTQRRHVYR